MGILDMLTNLAGQAGQAAQGDQAKVAGGFIEALTSHPEGITGILNSLKANGMADHVSQWANGQAAQATPEQVQQGLSGTGFLESFAQKAGVSPAIASAAVATILPMAIQHFAPNGQAASQSSMGSLATEFLGKLTGNAS